MKEQETGKLYVRNWDKFQHYKDRRPPWIKLHTDTFQNYEFSRLHDASKLLAIGMWTLASKTKYGEICDDFDFISKQLGLNNQEHESLPVTKGNLQELIDKGFIIRRQRKQYASRTLSPRKQNGVSETETETEAEPITPTPLSYEISERKVADFINCPKLENPEPKPLNGESKKCVMPGCGKPTQNGNPFCSDACRDYAQYLTTKNSGESA